MDSEGVVFEYEDSDLNAFVNYCVELFLTRFAEISELDPITSLDQARDVIIETTRIELLELAACKEYGIIYKITPVIDYAIQESFYRLSQYL